MSIWVKDQPGSTWRSFLESEGFFARFESGGVPAVHGTEAIAIVESGGLDTSEALRRGFSVVIGDEAAFHTLRAGEPYEVHETLFELNTYLYTAVEAVAKKARVFSCRIKNGTGEVLLLGYEHNIHEAWRSSRQSVQDVVVDWDRDFFAQEKLCAVSKKNLRAYLKDIMRRAHEFLDIPMVYIWKYPHAFRSVFNIRVDVDPDKSAPNEVALEKIHRCFDNAKIYADRSSFMVNFYQRYPDFSFIKPYIEQGYDVQSHNFVHALFPFKSMNRANIELADALLRKYGAQPSGFCAPEYFWYENAADVLEATGYRYSHSFGYDYANYPYRPVVGGKIREYIELPVDPLVRGKLAAATGTANPKALLGCYDVLLQAKYSENGQPCLIYVHPAGEGAEPDTMQWLFDFPSRVDGVMPITLTSWASWMQRRFKVLCDSAPLRFEQGKIHYEDNALPEDMTLAVERREDKVVLIRPPRDGQTIDESAGGLDIICEHNFTARTGPQIGDVIYREDYKSIERTYMHWKKLFMYMRSSWKLADKSRAAL